MDPFGLSTKNRLTRMFGRNTGFRRRLRERRARMYQGLSYFLTKGLAPRFFKGFRNLLRNPGKSLKRIKASKTLKRIREKIAVPFQALGTAFVGLGPSLRGIPQKLASPLLQFVGILQSVAVTLRDLFGRLDSFNRQGPLHWHCATCRANFSPINRNDSGRIGEWLGTLRRRWLEKAHANFSGLIYATASMVAWFGTSVAKRGESIEHKAMSIRDKGDKIYQRRSTARLNLDLLKDYSDDDLSTCVGSIRSQSSKRDLDE